MVPKMAGAEEIPQLNDCFIVNLDIEDSPSAEIPLTELYDMVTSTFLDNYREPFAKRSFKFSKIQSG